MGDWDTSTTSEVLPYVEFEVSRRMVHPKYDATNLKNDIVVLRLAEPVPLGKYPHISTVCLSRKFT